MIFILKLLSKIFQIILNLVSFVQISLVLLVFLTTSYWFFNLINSQLFSFAEPIVIFISNLVNMYHDSTVVINDIVMDGSILLFDVVSLILVFILTKTKFYLYKIIEYFDYAVIIKNRKIEKKLNEKLQQEAEQMIRKYKKAAIIIEFDAKNKQADNIWDNDSEKEVEEKIQDTIKIFYSSIKSISGCTFAKTDNILAILVDDFDKIDNVLLFIEQALKRIRDNMAKSKWELIIYAAADVYNDTKDFKDEVYPAIEKLLNLRYKNEIICYGSFNLRYDLVDDPKYHALIIKGDFDIDEGCTLYSLVKKD